MKTVKTSNLAGAALDWVVAKCEGLSLKEGYSPSTDWAQGGPIIEGEGISLIRQTPDRWVSEYSNGCDRIDHARSWGPTPLIAAMRCYVASKRGNEVEIPEELL